MSTKFQIQSSDPALLEKANRIARELVQEYLCEDIVGIVFLGAIVRGYFDKHADIDIAIFKKAGSEVPITCKFYQVEGIEVQIWLSDFENEFDPWDMAKRWTYSQCLVYYDPSGKIRELLEEKVPLALEEKKWLMMSGLTLSEWYINRLTQLWIERGNILSAHHMIDQGILYFFDMLFGLNNEMVADMKWRYYCVEQLERLPRDFKEHLQQVMLLHAFTKEDLERRINAFMKMWQEMRPIIENEVQMTFDEMVEVV